MTRGYLGFHMNINVKKITSGVALALALISVSLPGCSSHREEHHHEAHKIVATSPQVRDVTITERYVCQIHSQRHIQLRALERGYLEKIPVRERYPLASERDPLPSPQNIRQKGLNVGGREDGGRRESFHGET